jgi:hypothetical protein
MFRISSHTAFHSPSYNGSLVNAISSKADLCIFLGAFLFSCILQKCEVKTSIFFEDFLLFKFQDASFCGATVFV